MSKAIALIRSETRPQDLLRTAIVAGCAASLALAGQAFPLLAL